MASEADYKKLVERMQDLQSLMNRFGEIDRLIFMPDGARKDHRETDTEHSYHLAMHVWYVCQNFPELNQEKAMKYALAHDLVEVYAGDVMAIGRTQDEQKRKDLREAEALERLKVEWPDFDDLTKTIELYEQQNDPESVFVKALDKLMALLHQIMSEGKTWRKRDMDRRQVIENKDEKTKKSQEVTAIWQEIRAEILAHPEWFNEGKAT